MRQRLEASPPAYRPTMNSAHFQISFSSFLDQLVLREVQVKGVESQHSPRLLVLDLLQRESEMAAQLFCRHSGEVRLHNGHVEDLSSAP